MIRVAIVEDDSRYRASLATLFSLTDAFVLCATFADAEEACDHARALADDDAACPWDVVVMDMQMPRMNGIEGTQCLKAAFPELRILVLTVYEDPPTILQAICAGADGYLLKRSAIEGILSQVAAVAHGGAPLTPGVASTLLKIVRNMPAPAPPEGLHLTPRQHDVLRCLVEGRSYKQVAAELEISVDTVRSHIRRLYRKLRVHSVAEAVSKAIRDGLVA